jgi:formylglycine-generating enzyme required for sulfatase activity
LPGARAAKYDRAERHVVGAGAERDATAAWLGLAGPGAVAPPPMPPPHRAGAGARVPDLDDCVTLPAGEYRLGEPGEERTVALRAVRVGRHPVANEHWRAFCSATGRPLSAAVAAPVLADHPVTGVTRDEALAFCAWAGERIGARVRLPTDDEWEAVARGPEARTWPWGDTFDPERCNCAEAAWGATLPVGAHPDGAGAFGAEQLAGNVWEWVAGGDADGWAHVRGGCYLDTAWGVRASRVLSADPARATSTTGFRIAVDPDPGGSP